MNHKLMIIAIACSLFLSCQRSPEDNPVENVEVVNTAEVKSSGDIPFTVLNKYFVKNNISENVFPKIENEKQFEETFGFATTMGPDGKPTEINFETQFVIAVVLPETDTATNVSISSLQKSDNVVTLKYKITRGEYQSFTMKPMLAVAVDKAGNPEVIVEEDK